MALLSNAAITGFRNYVKRTVKYARYKLNGTWIDADLQSVVVDSDGVVRISFMIYPGSNGGTVSEVQIYDTDNQLWFSKTASLNMASVAEGFYYLVKFTIAEVNE